MRGITTTAKGLGNAAAGTIGAGLGTVGGGLATAGGYGTDALGLTQNAGPSNWAGTKAFVGTMGDAALNGVRDTAGGVADTLSGGAYNYDGSLLNPESTAVDHMRDRHVQQLGPGSAAAKAYGAANAIGDFAGETAIYGGLGAGISAARGVSPAAKTLSMSTPVSQVPGAYARRFAQQGIAGKALEVGGAGAAVAGKAFDANNIANADSAGTKAMQDIFPDASPEQTEQIASGAQQINSLPQEQKDMASRALQNPEGEEAQGLAGQGQRNFIDENMQNAPTDPNAFGSFMNQTISRFNNMPMEMKIGLGLGLGGGLLGLMGSLNEGGIGNFLMAALGLGGAGFAAANSGLLGDNMQQMTGGALMNAGSALGFNMPEKGQDLSALLADDPIAASGGNNLGMFSRPADINAAVDAAEQKKQQLAQLQAAPAWLRPTILRAIDPEHIKTTEDAELAAANASKVYNQLNNEDSDVHKQLVQAKQWANSGWNPARWWYGDKAAAFYKAGFNAVDAKELHDLKHEQKKKYDLKNARRLNQLALRKQHDCRGAKNPPAVRRMTIMVIRKAANAWAA